MITIVYGSFCHIVVFYTTASPYYWCLIRVSVISSSHSGTQESKSSASNSKIVSSAVDHPYLNAFNAASIRVFLRSYGQYVNEVTERAKQLVSENVSTSDNVSPVSLSFCVDSERLESLINLEFIPAVSARQDLSYYKLRLYLDSNCKKSKEVVTVKLLNAMLYKELRINMAKTLCQVKN